MIRINIKVDMVQSTNETNMGLMWGYPTRHTSQLSVLLLRRISGEIGELRGHSAALCAFCSEVRFFPAGVPALQFGPPENETLPNDGCRTDCAVHHGCWTPGSVDYFTIPWFLCPESSFAGWKYPTLHRAISALRSLFMRALKVSGPNAIRVRLKIGLNPNSLAFHGISVWGSPSSDNSMCWKSGSMWQKKSRSP